MGHGMKARINPLFEQTSFDSAAPNGAAAVVHKFGDAGEYVVRFISGEANLSAVRLTVGSDPSEKALPPEGVSIDLTKIEYSSQMGGADGHEDFFVVRPKGYVAFTAASPKAKPYAVVAKSAYDAETKDKLEFDSRRLGANDIFTLTLMRPGNYRVVNELGKYEGVITVAYPVIGDRPYRPPSPLEVDVNDSGFEPSTIKLQPAQGVIFKICTAARIKIDLIQPDDGPKDRPPRKVGISPQVIRQAVERWRQEQQKKKKKS